MVPVIPILNFVFYILNWLLSRLPSFKESANEYQNFDLICSCSTKMLSVVAILNWLLLRLPSFEARQTNIKI